MISTSSQIKLCEPTTPHNRKCMQAAAVSSLLLDSARVPDNEPYTVCHEQAGAPCYIERTYSIQDSTCVLHTYILSKPNPHPKHYKLIDDISNIN